MGKVDAEKAQGLELWVPSTYVKSRCGCSSCNSSTMEAESGGSLRLAGQLV